MKRRRAKNEGKEEKYSKEGRERKRIRKGKGI
jgi:hypothetical protein